MDLWPQFLNRIYHGNNPDKGINSKLRGHLGKMSFPNKWKMKAELVFRATQAQARFCVHGGGGGLAGADSGSELEKLNSPASP